MIYNNYNYWQDHGGGAAPRHLLPPRLLRLGRRRLRLRLLGNHNHNHNHNNNNNDNDNNYNH